ncbi:Penicillin acylase 2 proenzyme [Xanthomonas arboricola pv. corylina]|uniref:Penicillin acylase 2 proenzyme n=2 Tax=Xanthomonas arboricola TaxID=56448 RepID=A0A2S7CHS6_9XANT|nr:penicillin acylase family protein [Xanthomonas arboricola pv. corylina]PPU61120.1 penicillin acylase family protein [Xanthomonas arboricola pv. corylina]CAE6745955.1 Penicillin acylase 2 proenzyme [Xanthomonas arboricola pv. corylina]CAE6745967.1 Penicillin acylase 2 proenzyme [Xanthomonas arboricola pv. corylina]CAE6806408.1 Penicillin acylase 2 proenzyme [Xanthomonas arboricola pv. corylina]
MTGRHTVTELKDSTMRKWLGRLLLAIVVLIVAAVLAAYLLMRGSLPQLDGNSALRGLAAPVSVQRDRRGVVTIDAASQVDAMRALGYVHAQERYFEMDLMRRAPAGELSELFGAAALDPDKRNRVHRLRARVHASLDVAAGSQRAALQAYTEGVNAGLAALHVRPWPYLLLRQTPRAWTLDDSILTGMAMYADLQDNDNQTELAAARIRAVVPAALAALLDHQGSSWDAPLFGPAHGDAVLPDAATLDLRRLPHPAAPTGAEPPTPGSNNFAVDGSLTSDGRAIVADDMHLGLRAPNIWFRARLRYPDTSAPDGKVDVTGFTLPGLPAVVVGSNGHVAWAFTNSYIDTADFARIAPSTPGHPQTLTTHVETIRVAGAAPVRFAVRESAWGPILHDNPDGSLLALRWAAQLPGASRLDFAQMSTAADVQAAFAVADRSGIPAQNLLLADRSGRIAWRLIGARPVRNAGCGPGGIAELASSAQGADAASPSPTATAAPAPGGCLPWPVRSDAAPALIDPPSHRLWTANSRVVDAQQLATLGNAGYDLGARAQQIRDDLFARQRFNELDLLAIQLDDRAVLLTRWWQLLRSVVEHSKDPALQQIEAATRQWDGHASTRSASYRIVRGFRGMTIDAVEAGLLAPAKAALGKDFLPPRRAQLEGIVWPLLQQRPAHLLPPAYASWDQLLAEAARNAQTDLAAQDGALSERTWGERNTAAICHPIARALPALAKRWLCMPPDQLPGDRDMPRVQGPAFGASERMVVSPGHEQDGIVHMPGGQSGHPLSPFWGAGHDDWVHGRPTPFLPTATRYTLQLQPK